MSYSANRFDVFNSMSNPMGVPPHDFVKNTVTNGNITKTDYYSGGAEDEGTLVASIEFTYDGSGNILTIKRVV